MHSALPALLLALTTSFGDAGDIVNTREASEASEADPNDERSASSEVVASDPLAVNRAPRPDLVAPTLTRGYAIAVNRRARGVGVGLRQGLFGGGFGQSLHVDVPFGRRVGQFVGARLTGTIVHIGAAELYDPVAFGGLELFGRTPVIGGLIRLYGGGGLIAGGRLQAEIDGERYGFSGSGHMGVEFFANPRLAFNVELGGQGPVHALGLDAGASVLGGATIYFGR